MITGDFGCITWTGYDFATDVSMNRETARWLWIKRVHDGPVTHSVRSNYYHQVVVTIGGKIFAVWRDDFSEPLVWKKSNVRWVRVTWWSKANSRTLLLPRQSKLARALSDFRRVYEEETVLLVDEMQKREKEFDYWQIRYRRKMILAEGKREEINEIWAWIYFKCGARLLLTIKATNNLSSSSLLAR